MYNYYVVHLIVHNLHAIHINYPVIMTSAMVVVLAFIIYNN